MRKSLLIPMALLLSAVVVLSCEKDSSRNVNPGRNTGINMVADVIDAAEYIETKSGAIAQLKNVYGEPGDDFIITEYVTDIAAALPQTKGTEIKTGNIDSKYGKFHTTAFLEDTVNFSLNHKLPVSGGWEGTAPKWVSRMTYDIWSYAPATMDSEETNFNVSSDALTFTHSVPKALEAQKDLVFAHNEETRNFYDPESKSFVPDPSKPEKDPNIKVKFYHALSAVKFVLDVTDTQTASAADVHSITLCYIDSATGNIETTSGIATTADCTVTGGAGTVSFNWENYSDNKPLHYVFNDTYPRTSSCVANGYCNTGDGVMFMIPQTATDISVIVEFSKYGGEDLFYTKVKKLNNINWQAGYFYTYKLQIGAFHVPGELLAADASVNIKGLKNSSDKKVFTTSTPTMDSKGDFKIKGVKKVGMILGDKYIKMNTGSGEFNFVVAPNGAIPSSVPASESFTFNFDETNVPATGASYDTIYEFGNNDTVESYKTVYREDLPNGEKTYPGTYYYVFDVNGLNTFNICFKISSNDNSARYESPVRCLMILEVNSDTLPGNFSTINWNNI